MQHGRLKMGFVAATSVAASLTLAAQPAFADYAPVANDVVGVGSDTVQYASDFTADGDFLGDPGYNTLGNKYKVINFDATPDANARLAYGPDGLGNASGTSCAPGTGGTAGTGDSNTKHADQPCTLNPTIVLQAGLSPVQRPNGSGGGAKAIATDTHKYIDYARASSAQGATLGAGFDSVTIGTDPLAMLSSTTSHAVALSAQQLKLIYACTDTTWTSVGGASSNTIIPIVPQVGSGTRSSFLSAIGNPTLGACVQTAEENDPLAIAAQSSPDDAIEPMSGGRLNLFLGKLSTGASNGVGGYFKDPSCSLNAIAASTPSACAAASNGLTPDVKLWTTGSPSDSNPVLNISRPLYIYFRDADVTSATPFQPGGQLNWVRTLFYNPCTAPPTGCTTVGGFTYGPGGAPFVNTSPGQAVISAAGITPTYAVTVGGP